jgi:plasmid maintenance system antidote protein VapI
MSETKNDATIGGLIAMVRAARFALGEAHGLALALVYDGVDLGQSDVTKAALDELEKITPLLEQLPRQATLHLSHAVRTPNESPLNMQERKERQRGWLLEQLKLKGHGSRSALAKHLGIRNDAVTRMANLEPGKEAQEITFEELLGMAKFFGSSPPGLENVTKSFQND